MCPVPIAERTEELDLCWFGFRKSIIGIGKGDQKRVRYLLSPAAPLSSGKESPTPLGVWFLRFHSRREKKSLRCCSGLDLQRECLCVVFDAAANVTGTSRRQRKRAVGSVLKL